MHCVAKCVFLLLLYTLIIIPAYPDGNVHGSPHNPPLSNTSGKDCNISVFTNLCYWGIGIMNLGGEIKTGYKTSVYVFTAYNPWFQSPKLAARTLLFQPGARYWFSGNTRGHAAGVHLSCAWFNILNGNFRYQDAGRPASGAGIDYTWRKPLGKNFNMEFSAGIGWTDIKYDRFINFGDGHLDKTSRSSYFGPDQISFSISYDL